MLPEVEKYFARKSDGKAKKAFKALNKSDNPFVRWIAGKPELFGSRYVSYTEEVLGKLPMTREELYQLGEHYGLGETFRSFVREAESAGVLPATTATTVQNQTSELYHFGTPVDNAVNVTVNVAALRDDLANAYGYGGESVKNQIENIIRRNAR